MKIKEIYDMEEYLTNRCYCPNEIYSIDGFFYQIFKPDFECELISSKEEIIKDSDAKTLNQTIIVSKPASRNPETVKPQLILITAINGVVKDAIRIDATENNIKGMKNWLHTREKFTVDEYVKGSTAKALKEILSMADAVIIS